MSKSSDKVARAPSYLKNKMLQSKCHDCKIQNAVLALGANQENSFNQLIRKVRSASVLENTLSW